MGIRGRLVDRTARGTWSWRGGGRASVGRAGVGAALCAVVLAGLPASTTAVVLAGLPAISSADSIRSENWSGYVAHGGGVAFRSVTAAWTEPAAVCPTLGYPTWSATWVGLGGYAIGATALEQIGTELDCDGSGRALVSAFYELVPALPQTIGVTVRAGDRISAGVVVSGQAVTLRLVDRTRRRTFSKTVRTPSLDVSSADWILEAPTECDPYGFCLTTPLTDFGGVQLTGARAETTAGKWGRVAGPSWRTTRITLLPDPNYYALDDSASVSTPGRLGRGGGSFGVYYSTTRASSLRGARAAARGAAGVNPGGVRRLGSWP